MRSSWAGKYSKGIGHGSHLSKLQRGQILHYIYLKKTIFGRQGEYFGYGCLITDHRIHKRVLDDALRRLREDPDIRNAAFAKQDQETLDAGYFHAAHDSKNAHSHLCTAINEHVVGRFCSHVFNVNKNAFGNFREASSLATKLTILDVFSETPEITFVLTNRGDLTEDSVRIWWSNLWNDLLKSSFTFPYRTLFYPRLTFEIRDKDEPGLQIVDFLIWAANRKTLRKKCPWLDRIKAPIRFQTEPDDDSWGGQSLYMGFPLLAKTKISHYDMDDYRQDDPILNSGEMLWRYLVHVQRTINIVYKNGVTSTIDHFWGDIEYLYKNKISNRDPGFVEKLAVCFLKLFDNYPVINQETSPDDKAFWLFCRKRMAFMLNEHDVLSQLYAITFHDIRIFFIDNEPKCLELC